MLRVARSYSRAVIRPIVLLLLLACTFLAPPPLGHRALGQIPHFEPAKADLVIVHKSQRTLQLMHQGHVLKTFRIALGPDPAGPKRQEGDGRTPEGVYVLDWRNPNSSFYRAIHISYPRKGDETHAVRWGVRPGGLIMVHGLPNGVTPDRIGHPSVDWTNGCIAVTNEEMDEIWARVEDGTTIIIYP
jgi:murein L,D-transpeptidase YafK